MTYVILLLLIAIILIVLIKLFKFKLYNPAIIFLAGYFVSILFANIGTKTWNSESELSLKTMIVVVATLISFTIGAFLPNLFGKHKKTEKENKYNINRVVHISIPLCILLFCVISATVVSEYIDLKRICSAYSCSAASVSELISFFRSKGMMFNDDGETMSFLTNQLIKISNVAILYSIYIFINNIAHKDGLKKNIRYLPIIALAFPVTLLTSGRSASLVIIMASIIIYFFVETNAKGRLAPVKIGKTIKKILPIFIAIIAGFYLSSSLVGRNADDYDFLDYSTFYYGCSVPSLNIVLREEYDPNLSPLNNSLRGIGDLFGKLFGRNSEVDKYSLKFVQFSAGKQAFSGNVYTSGYRLLLDFGVFFPIFVLISGFVYAYLCKKAEKTNDIRVIIFFALFASKILDSARSEGFYGTFLSMASIIYLTLVLIVGAIIVNGNRKERK